MRHFLSFTGSFTFFVLVPVLLTQDSGTPSFRDTASTPVPRPRISSISPSSGPLGGRNTLTLYGAHFLPGAQVQIQGANCPNVFRVSSQQITCTPLARKSGTYHVRVLNPDGQIALLKSAYTYRPDPPLVDHGVAARFSSAWGTFATTGQSGRNRVSVWLSDHRGCDSILSVDVESGENSMVYLPAPRGKQAPTRSLLSERGKIYALFGGRFFEFDPDTQQLSFQQEIQTENQPVYYWETAMGMTESSDGMIWAVTWPYSHLYSFNPVTKQLSSYGSANKEQWHQYPGYIATDSSGWIYIGIGTSLSQVVAFNPETAAPGGNSTFLPLLSSSERVPGSAFVYTDMDGNVYGLAEGGQRTGWFRFSNGQKTALTGNPPNRRKLIRTGFQDFVINHFRDGSTLTQLDLIEKKLVVTSAQGSQKTIPLRYETEGGAIVSLTATAFGSICGSAAFPMRLFCFSPQAMGWNSRATAHQANVFAVEGSEIFFGSYPEGSLSQWRPTSQSIGEPTSLVPSSSFSLLRRPHELLVTPDRNSLILAGTPGYGLTGGGLVIWNRTTGAKKEIPHTALLAHHSTMSLVTLPDGRIIGGSTIRAGTGGVNLAPEAELYQFDPVAERVIWRQVVIPKVHTYAELISTADNKVLGIADGRIFFVFDPTSRSVIQQENLQTRFGSMAVSEQSQQGPRIFVKDSQGVIYILLQKGIVRVDPTTFETRRLIDFPFLITGGGDFLNGRIYFFSGSHLYSYQPPPTSMASQTMSIW